MLEPIFSGGPDDTVPPDQRSNATAVIPSLAGPIPVTTCASPPAASELSMFQTQRRELHVHAAAKVGLAMLGANVSGRRVVVVQDFYRAAPCTADDGTVILYGVSARLVVDIAGFDANASLTLPVMAAQVEMGLAKAQYTLGAKGYVGDISGIVTVDPGALTIDNYVKLTQSMATLQGLLGGTPENLRPVPLFVDLPDGSSHDAERRWAVGTTFALSCIADGRSLNKAKDSDVAWETWSAEAQEAIVSIYGDLMGDADPDTRPVGGAQAAAKNYLGPLRVRS